MRSPCTALPEAVQLRYIRLPLSPSTRSSTIAHTTTKRPTKNAFLRIPSRRVHLSLCAQLQSAVSWVTMKFSHVFWTLSVNRDCMPRRRISLGLERPRPSSTTSTLRWLRKVTLRPTFITKARYCPFRRCSSRQYITVHRVCPRTHRGYFLIAHTAFHDGLDRGYSNLPLLNRFNIQSIRLSCREQKQKLFFVRVSTFSELKPMSQNIFVDLQVDSTTSHIPRSPNRKMDKMKTPQLLFPTSSHQAASAC